MAAAAVASETHAQPQSQQQQQQLPRLAWPVEGGPRQVREVWAWNFEHEFAAFIFAALQPSSGGSGALLALDTEFPGFVCETPWTKAPAVTYQALRENVDVLWPIQIGVAVAGYDGTVRGVWSFNLRFDAAIDHHSKSSMAFLRQAGIDFARHRVEGIQSAELGRRLASSALVGPHAPCWLTFSGLYDLGYLLKLLTMGRPLPSEMISFDRVVSMYCPRRCDLRDLLPVGSLEALGKKHGVKRHGQPHTAGSDALLTLELYLHLVTPEPMVMPRTQDKTWNLVEDWTGWGRDRLWHYYWGNSWAAWQNLAVGDGKVHPWLQI